MARTLTLIGVIFALIGGIFTALGAGLAWGTGELGLLIFAAIGGLFLLLGGAFLLWTAHTRRRRARLLADGMRIDAEIFEVGYDFRCRVNGRCPFVIRCQAVSPEDGRVYVFQSEGFWFDPARFLAGVTTLPVYVDPHDYRRYAVDTAGILPQQG